MSQLTFTQLDLQRLASHGLTPRHVRFQVEQLRSGIPSVHIQRPCTTGDGINVIDPSLIDALTQKHAKAALAGRTMKFVPASGAASRMFQCLVSAHARGHHYKDDMQAIACLNAINNFAFVDDLRLALRQHGLNLDTLIAQKRHDKVIEYLLMPKGLNYAHQPKGLIKFHRYPDHCRTPLEEHLVEAADYTRTRRNIARIHFTVSPEHQKTVSAYIANVKTRYERDGVQLHISYSLQKPSTDTVAVDETDELFRDKHGAVVLRQAGHGALIENLNELQSDIVFIKNIDNVVPDRLKAQASRYKKALCGLLVDIQEELFGSLEHLSVGTVEASELTRMIEWGQSTFSFVMPADFRHQTNTERIHSLYHRLNRPLRVCGMVRNANAPGGGPFWVQHDDGTQSIQIVEMAQINTTSANQRAILESSTHLNPVDIVCGLRDYRGNAFDLRQFVDPHTGIITHKSHEGRTLKAIERPGLWNGCMAHWNTIFVEVPPDTFNPVKTVFDLLHPAHQ